MRVLDLFSGIGGFSLGLERAGMETVAFCEIEPYCQKVLAKHWPGIPIYDDVRTLNADTLRRDGIAVDVICGGFPCQDISVAGKGAGLTGERSGLWFEYRRIIRDVRPQWIIVENVPAILTRGGSTVTNQLAALGYDCLWECIPACAVGAPHRRDRWWCVAYAKRDAIREQSGRRCRANGASTAQFAINGEAQSLADTTGSRCEQSGLHDSCDQASAGKRPGNQPSDDSEAMADSISIRELQPQRCEQDQRRRAGNSGEDGGNANGAGLPLPRQEPVRANGQQGWGSSSATDWRGSKCGLGGVVDGPTHWMDEPGDVPRTATGQPNRVSRLRGLGNAVVPQIPELIGRAVMESA